MNKQQATAASSSGIGFLGLLTLVFITLKLTGYITWSWWLVLLPMYAIPAIVVGIIMLIFTVAYLVAMFEKYFLGK